MVRHIVTVLISVFGFYLHLAHEKVITDSSEYLKVWDLVRCMIDEVDKRYRSKSRWH